MRRLVVRILERELKLIHDFDYYGSCVSPKDQVLRC